MPLIELEQEEIQKVMELMATEVLDINDSENSGPEDLSLAMDYMAIMEKIKQQRG
jgi:hypothetical protein